MYTIIESGDVNIYLQGKIQIKVISQLQDFWGPNNVEN